MEVECAPARIGRQANATGITAIGLFTAITVIGRQSKRHRARMARTGHRDRGPRDRSGAGVTEQTRTERLATRRAGRDLARRHTRLDGRHDDRGTAPAVADRALVGLAGVAGHAVQGLWRPIPSLDLVWYLVLDVAVHAALVGWGQWTQARDALLASLRERAVRAEREQGRRIAEARMLERTRMAREMHDVLAHRLSLLATSAGALEYRPDASPEKLAKAAGVIRSGVHQALEEPREVISVLRDSSEIEELASGRPQPTFGDLSALVEESREAGATVRYEQEVSSAESLPPATGRTAYRVVQEGLTNARKHAAGQPVTLKIRGGPGTGLVIELTNPEPTAPSGTPGSGTGLVGLTERVRLAGGVLDHGRTPAGGFRLHASLRGRHDRRGDPGVAGGRQRAGPVESGDDAGRCERDLRCWPGGGRGRGAGGGGCALPGRRADGSADAAGGRDHRDPAAPGPEEPSEGGRPDHLRLRRERGPCVAGGRERVPAEGHSAGQDRRSGPAGRGRRPDALPRGSAPPDGT